MLLLNRSQVKLMNMRTRRVVIGAVLLITLAGAALAAVVYQMSNNTGVEDYKANKPSVPISEIAEDQPEEIAATLIDKWVGHFKTGEVSWASKIKDYRISGVRVEKQGWPLLASAAFSVKPTRWSYDNWMAGNGVATEDGWIKDKSLFFSITKEKDMYKLQELGSAP